MEELIMNRYGTLALLVASGVLAGGASAAVITWEAASTSVTSAGDIINDGADATNITFEHDIWPSGTATNVAANGAINFGPAPAGAINGVTFASGGGSGPFWATTGDTDLDAVVGHHTAFGGAGDPWTVIMTGLTENTDYMIQVIGIHDNRTVGDIPTRSYNFTDTDGGSASPTLVRATGGSVIGTFSTGAGETSITINGNSVSGNDPGAGGIVLRVVPEPGSLALLGLGGLALLRRRRG